MSGADPERMRRPHRTDAGGADPDPVRPRRRGARRLVPAVYRTASFRHVRLHDRSRRTPGIRPHASRRMTPIILFLLDLFDVVLRASPI